MQRSLIGRFNIFLFILIFLFSCDIKNLEAEEFFPQNIKVLIGNPAYFDVTKIPTPPIYNNQNLKTLKKKIYYYTIDSVIHIKKKKEYSTYSQGNYENFTIANFQKIVPKKIGEYSYKKNNNLKSDSVISITFYNYLYQNQTISIFVERRYLQDVICVWYEFEKSTKSWKLKKKKILHLS